MQKQHAKTVGWCTVQKQHAIYYRFHWFQNDWGECRNKGFFHLCVFLPHSSSRLTLYVYTYAPHAYTHTHTHVHTHITYLVVSQTWCSLGTCALSSRSPSSSCPPAWTSWPRWEAVAECPEPQRCSPNRASSAGTPATRPVIMWSRE